MSGLAITPFHSLRGRGPHLLFVGLLGLVLAGLPQNSAAGPEAPLADAEVLDEPEAALRGGVLYQASIRYQVTHPLASFEGALDASHVDSELFFDEEAPDTLAGTIVVDLLGFSSGNKKRDKHAQRSLETARFPSAWLELRGLRGVKMEKVSDPQRARLRGSCQADLVLHGRRADWPVEVEVEWSRDELVVLSSFTVLLDDFSIPRDKLFGVAIRNEVPISVELRYRRP